MGKLWVQQESGKKRSYCVSTLLEEEHLSSVPEPTRTNINKHPEETLTLSGRTERMLPASVGNTYLKKKKKNKLGVAHESSWIPESFSHRKSFLVMSCIEKWQGEGNIKENQSLEENLTLDARIFWKLDTYWPYSVFLRLNLKNKVDWRRTQMAPPRTLP